MKSCPYCAEEIQDAAKVCKHCGRDLETNETAQRVQIVEPKRKTGCVTWAVAILFVLLFAGWCSSQFQTPEPTDITMSKFNQLNTGMTYQQVVDILGKGGQEMSRTELAGTTTVMFQWTANRGIGNMNAMFQNGRLISKAQFGLE